MSPRRLTRFLNAVIALSLIALLLVHIQRPDQEHRSPEGADLLLWNDAQSHPSNRAHIITNETVQRVLHEVWKRPPKVDEKKTSKNPQPVIEDEEDASTAWQFDSRLSPALTGELTGRSLVQSVHFLNEHAEILNRHKFGPVSDVRFVLVVQVHNRLEYLKHLVETLRANRYIQQTLLIFSHDYNSPPINALIRAIDFCMVLQIFYPYSIQLFPHVYPGQEENDCPEHIGQDAARERQCQNWETPDKYGNYRVAKFTQMKHHWIWKMSYVIWLMQRYNISNDTWIVRFEEDHYVAPDALYTLDSIVDNLDSLCPECEVIALGQYLKTYESYRSTMNRVDAMPWYSSRHNLGMSLRASTWQRITAKCADHFCKFDDYNWDWSLLHVSLRCLPNRLRALVVKSSRVMHVGECGVHTHRCNVNEAVEKARDLFARHADAFFPDDFRLYSKSRRTLKAAKENGGWGDARDHSLCMHNTHPWSPFSDVPVVLERLLTARSGFANVTYLSSSSSSSSSSSLTSATTAPSLEAPMHQQQKTKHLQSQL